MITAKEAKALYDESGAEAKALLKTFEPKIIEAAKSGKRWVIVFIDSHPTYETPHPTATQQRAIKMLEEFGYVSLWMPQYDDAYVPRGLADDDDAGPSYINCGIYIGW